MQSFCSQPPEAFGLHILSLGVFFISNFFQFAMVQLKTADTKNATASHLAALLAKNLSDVEFIFQAFVTRDV